MPSEWENNLSSLSTASTSSLLASSDATSPEPNTNGNNNNNDLSKHPHDRDSASKSNVSNDPMAYVARARVTRPAPPKPSCNPMQFVQIRPCNLYQSAQQQLKKAEEIKKVKEVMKEDPEDWQNNLDNWKSSRRKRVEHIIDRVVEVKKLEQEEHERTRRKAKTFSEMIEERGERSRVRQKLQSLASYTEDEGNDLSDLGIGTSSASGKSSTSEDCEVHSIVNESAEVENTPLFDIENNSCLVYNDLQSSGRISLLEYEASSSIQATSPVPYEYTYEGAIEDYKSRVSKATTTSIYKTPHNTEHCNTKSLVFERKTTDNENTENSLPMKKKDDIPKVDISKKRELFEKPEVVKTPTEAPTIMQSQEQSEKKTNPTGLTNFQSIKDRLCSLEKKNDWVDDTPANIIPGEITSVKERLQCLEQQKQQSSVNLKPNTTKAVAEVASAPPLKERLSSLQNALTKEEVKKPVCLVDEYQLEALKNEERARRQLMNKEEDLDKKSLNNNYNNNNENNTNNNKNSSNTNEDSTIAITNPTITTPTVGSISSIEGLDQKSKEDKVQPSTSANEYQEEFDSSINEALDMALYAIDQEKTIAHRVEKTERNPIDAQSENEDLKDSCKLYEPIYANVTSTKDDIKNDINALKVTSEPTMSDVQYSGNPIGIATESTTPNVCSSTTNLNSMERDHLDSNSISSFEDESYYQVPKSREPLYQVPKLQKPIPVYENIKMFFMGRGDEYTPVSVPMNLQPPKEKPPPPPIMDAADSNNADSDNVDSDNVETGSMGGSSTNTYDTLPHSVVDISPTGQSDMRFNSTKRIKKELRNKRFSFLGIEGCDDNYVEQNVVPPPDMIQILQEERRLEKQLYIKAGLYDNSDAGESRDSGVSENHSRQSSEPFTNSSDEPDQHEELFSIHAALMSRNSDHETLHMPQNRINMISDIEEANAKMQCIEDQIREQEEVLRVERELLQLEQEELKRQRDNLMLRENVARRELQHGAKMLMSVNHRSLQDLNATTNDSNNNNNIYANIHNQQIYQIDADYCRSTSDLQDFRRSKLNPIPPIKPSRSQVVSEEHIPMRTSHPNLHISTSSHGNMSRSTLHAISAAPKPKYNDAWLYPKKDYIENNAENWRMPYQQKRQSVPDAFNLTKTNEADPRRNQPNPVMRNNTDWTRSVSGSNISVVPNLKTGTNEGKHLPDTVIQTLTRRLQNKNIMDRKRLEEPQPIVPTLQMLPPQNIMQNSSSSRLIEKSVPHQQDKVLSVSGKKKCSHCGDELGRGAAMIIESLELFYHINCFKCCVCHLQLSDGRNGTDVRVRNHKLHCQNCYSSDDGIKFSCV